MRRPTIPIEKADMIYQPGTRNAVLSYQGDRFQFPGGDYSMGACYAYYGELSPREQLIDNLMNGLKAIIRDHVDPFAVHEMLCQLKEYREICAEDMPETREAYNRSRRYLASLQEESP